MRLSGEALSSNVSLPEKRVIMPDTNTVPFLDKLPADATNAEATQWLNRMRRLLDRWENLPDHEGRSMTPELMRQAREELDELESSISRNMACPTH